MINPTLIQWGILALFGIIFFFIAPYSKTVEEFFAAKSENSKQPGLFLLTSSLIISWIFAKSITNAANLGLEFGIIGGISYSVYYLSFIIGGIIIYQLRSKGGFISIHHFLENRFGRNAVIVFSLLIGIRLFNEVWSNTMVIGSYFGEQNTVSYYTSILVFTGLTLAYTIKGGLRSSLLTDAIQMVLFALLLTFVLAWILPDKNIPIKSYLYSSDWKMNSGLNLLFAALLQIFSYPFHDPVLTDRGFIGNPKTTLKSYLIAAVLGFICILAFSFIGVYASFKGLEGQAAVEVSKLLGVTAMLVMNLIMVTSAASTLDSTFSSFSKLIVIDLGKSHTKTVKKGRLVMILLVIAGTFPVFFSPEILSATTISGTMVMGLAPVFLLWKKPAPKLSFHLPVSFGIIVGFLLAIDYFPTWLVFSKGRYSELLWANVWGILACFVLYFIPILQRNGKK